MELIKRYVSVKDLKIGWGDTCPNCGKPFTERLEVYKDSLGDYTICPHCEGSFDVTINK